MIKREKAFSLAELLISLLVTSMILSATVPTITRRASSINESPFSYFNGANVKGVAGNSQQLWLGAGGGAQDANFGKLNIVKQYDVSPASRSPLISFFQKKETGSDLTYLGEIYSDTSQNLGIGSHIFEKVDDGTFNLNTAFGHNALREFLDGEQNTAIGTGSLASLKRGTDNTAVGFEAMAVLEEGYGNVAIGSYLGEALTNGNKNVAIGGFDAIGHLENGNSNIVIGEAMRNIKQATHNIAIGDSALDGDEKSNTEIKHNVALGNKALGKLKSGDDNVAIGQNALSSYTSTVVDSSEPEEDSYASNIAIGKNSLSSLVSSSGGNIALGSYALSGFSSGSQNIAIGANSDISSGSRNILIGYRTEISSYAGETPESSIAIGYKASAAGKYSIGIGYNAGAHNSLESIGIGKYAGGLHSGSNIIAIGNEALSGSNGNSAYRYFQGSKNIAIGDHAGSVIASDNNIAIGYHSLKGDEPSTKGMVGGENVALGNETMVENTSGKQNVAIGNNAIYRNTTGSNNTGVGYDALASNKGGSNNTAIGQYALVKFNGSYNTAVGSNAMAGADSSASGSSLTSDYTASYNTAVGYNALSNNIEGRYNVALGYNAGRYIRGSNNICIGNDTCYSGTSYYFELGGNGSNKYLYGSLPSPDPTASGWRSGTLFFDGYFYPKYLGGYSKKVEEIYVNSINYNRMQQNSDIRLKNVSGNSNIGLKEILQIQPKNFTFKRDKNKTPHVGVIAQDLQKIFPNSIGKDTVGYLTVSKDEMFYAMINSIKELYAKFQDMMAKISGLDKRIEQLEKQNAALEKRLEKLEAKESKK